jgi:hypothetical protein
VELNNTMKALVDLSPPVGVSLATFLGAWMPPIVYILTAVYTAFRLYYLITDKMHERRERAAGKVVQTKDVE